MHLLRAVPGGLPGGRHRRRPQFRIRYRDARRTLLQQGKIAGEWRPLGAGDRSQSRTRRAVPLGRQERMLEALAFYFFSAILIASAVMVIAARNPVHSVLFLILSFFNAAGLFVLLGAKFLGMILVVVYVGAVAVLFLFVVMMLDVDFAELKRGTLQYLPFGALIGLILVAELIMVGSGWALKPAAGVLAHATPMGVTNTEAL